MKFIVILILSITINLPLQAHDIHVSVSDLYRGKNGKLELTIKIFYDDLLAAVGLVPGEELPDDYTSSDDLIQKYLEQNFQLKINGITHQLDYVETVAMMPAIWVTLQPRETSVDEIEKIEILNTIFLDLFNDQTNMVNIKLGNNRKNFLLNGKKNTVEWVK